MNWTSAKNKLIILFLGINLLLGWANYMKYTSAYVLKEQQIQDISAVLEKNNIFLDTPMPKEYKPLPKITVFPLQIDSSDRDDYVKKLLGNLDDVKISIDSSHREDGKVKRIYSKGSQTVEFEDGKVFYSNKDNIASIDKGNVDIIDTEDAVSIGDKYMEKVGYSPRKMYMQVDCDSNDGYEITYYDKYEGIPIFDSYVKLKVTNAGVSNMEIHKVRLGEVSGGKKEIYPIDQVFFYLIKLISSEQPVHVENIIMGYGLENPEGRHLIPEKALPFYQIILDNGKSYYINAYNSEIREEPRI